MAYLNNTAFETKLNNIQNLGQNEFSVMEFRVHNLKTGKIQNNCPHIYEVNGELNNRIVEEYNTLLHF